VLEAWSGRFALLQADDIQLGQKLGGGESWGGVGGDRLSRWEVRQAAGQLGGCRIVACEWGDSADCRMKA
jgi:hypothetical protein